MNVKSLKERLTDVPDDYDVQLQTMLCFLDDGTGELEDGPFEYRYHEPIIGIAWDDEDKEVVFILRNPDLTNATLKNYEEID